MRVVHVSYASVPSCDDPATWLKQIDFFTGIVSSMTRKHEVHSIHCIGYEGKLEKDGATYHFFKLGLWEKYFPWRLNTTVEKLRPDVAIIHSFLFPWQVMLLKWQLPQLKIFVQHHAEKPLRFPKYWLQRWVDRNVLGYFFTSAELSRPWLKSRLILSPEKIHEIMEVSSPFFVLDNHKAREKNLFTDSPAYLWVGRLDKNKDPETLLKAFTSFATQHPKVKLDIIFRGRQLIDRVKLLADAKPDNIKLIGEAPHGDLLNYYNAADFIISTSHYEGSGVAVCEAMSCGCIPILTDIPSFRMMTDEGKSGLLFKPGDEVSLLGALNKSLTLNIQEEKKKVLEQFNKNLSFDAIADKLDRVITHAL